MSHPAGGGLAAPPCLLAAFGPFGCQAPPGDVRFPAPLTGGRAFHGAAHAPAARNWFLRRCISSPRPRLPLARIPLASVSRGPPVPVARLLLRRRSRVLLALRPSGRLSVAHPSLVVACARWLMDLLKERRTSAAWHLLAGPRPWVQCERGCLVRRLRLDRWGVAAGATVRPLVADVWDDSPLPAGVPILGEVAAARRRRRPFSSVT